MVFKNSVLKALPLIIVHLSHFLENYLVSQVWLLIQFIMGRYMTALYVPPSAGSLLKVKGDNKLLGRNFLS